MLSDIGRYDRIIRTVFVDFFNDGFRSVRFWRREDHLVFVTFQLCNPFRMFMLRECFQDLCEDLLHISPETHVRADVLSDLRTVDIDMDRHAFLCIFV